MIKLDNARQWLGRVDVRTDRAGTASLAALFATLDRDDAPPGVGEALPPLGHWLYFVAHERRTEMGEDGSDRGAFLPPIELPRHSWASSHLRFHRPLRVGDPISRLSRIVDIGEPEGGDAPVVSVLLRHEIGDAAGVALSEDQRIVFRHKDARRAEPGLRRSHGAPAWTRSFRADTRTLFRYAALTFDSRRIHYDRPFATFTEGHPGLVVQDGLVAHLLLDLLRRHAPGASIASCRFEVIRPVFDTDPLTLHGRPAEGGTVDLWAEDARGALAMEAVATLDEAGGRDDMTKGGPS